MNLLFLWCTLLTLMGRFSYACSSQRLATRARAVRRVVRNGCPLLSTRHTCIQHQHLPAGERRRRVFGRLQGSMRLMVAAERVARKPHVLFSFRLWENGRSRSSMASAHVQLHPLASSATAWRTASVVICTRATGAPSIRQSSRLHLRGQ